MDVDASGTVDSVPRTEFVVLPVLDLLQGQAVHGIGGKRSEYQPLSPISDPVAVAANLATTYHPSISVFYVADLDALEGRGPQLSVMRELLVATESRIWIDAGVSSADGALRLLDRLDADRLSIVVASVTLRQWDGLHRIVTTVGPENVIFSLDLFGGHLRGGSSEVAQTDVADAVRHVSDLGVTRIIVLDVAAVGLQQGPWTLDLCARIQKQDPRVHLITGGGVRSIQDLESIRAVGCAGALVATAFHNASIRADDLLRFL